MHVADPVFPPLLTGHPVQGSVRAFEEACRGAAAGSLGAGDVVWSRDTSLADLAIVLEPEVPLMRALQMAPLFMAALGDSLGALLPPQYSVLFRWPDIVLLNGGEVGKLFTGVSSPDVAAVPDWLVVGTCLVLKSRSTAEPGETAHLTDFFEEGAGDLTRTDILQSVSAHFLAWLNVWQDEGFRPVHDHWIERVEGYEQPAQIRHDGELVEGRVLGLDEELNLLVKPSSGPTFALPLMNCVAPFRRAAAS